MTKSTVDCIILMHYVVSLPLYIILFSINDVKFVFGSVYVETNI
jgi:hypothetical protein